MSPWVEFATSDFQSPVGGSYLFSADNRYLAWGSKDGSIILIDLATLKTHIGRFEAEMNELR